MAKMTNSSGAKLKAGMDSGDPPASVKITVALNSGGKCCFPDCPNHLTHINTKVTECAHIIPRKVGFVREDWKTPLDDRKKASNLIYICSIHHEIIDDKANAAEYPATKLYAWKAEHEEWVRKNNKNGANVPESVRRRLEETLASLDKELTAESNVSKHLMERLLADCKTLLRKRSLDKAEVLLVQAESLLSDIDDNVLKSELKALQAELLWRQGDIRAAKSSYLALLNNSHHLEGMIDYIELCDTAPEDGDLDTKYEKLIKKLAPDHLRLKLIALNKQYRRQEALTSEILEKKWSGDNYINGQFYLIYSLFLDLAGDTEKRDHFINEWKVLLPESPRPTLLRIIYLIMDALRRGIANSEEALKLYEEFGALENILFSDSKDPLSLHDQTTFLVEKIKAYRAVMHFGAGDSQQLGRLRDELFAVVNKRYFDRQLNQYLPEVLGNILMDLPQWRGLVSIIEGSKVVPTEDLIDLIFIQGLNIGIDSLELRRFISHAARDDLGLLLDAIENNNVTAIVGTVGSKKIQFILPFVQSIRDATLRAEIVQRVELPKENEIEVQHLKIDTFAEIGREKEALQLAKQLDLQKTVLPFLRRICEVAYKFHDYKLTIECGELILAHEIPNEYRYQLHGKLATAYTHLDDDREAFKHASEAVKRPDILGETNTRILVVIAANALLTLDKNDQAANFLKEYTDLIPQTPELGVFFAETVLKSSLVDKAETAYNYLSLAFKNAPPNNENIYMAALLVLIELDKLGVISADTKDKVEDDQFVKIHGIENTWFYTGQEADSFGATALNKTDPRYLSIIGRSPGDELDWPADKYSAPREHKKVALALDRGGYFRIRAHEVMQDMAGRGHKAIWSINVLDKDGTFNKENLVKFHEEQYNDRREFFQAYCKHALPFSMLCTIEGSLHQGLSKLVAERKGFVRCNSGTSQDLKEQYQIANKIMGGLPFFIDSLSGLMLCEAGLLELVVNNLPNIHITPSAIKPFRELAEALRPSSSSGHLGYANGRIQMTERDTERESIFRQELLAAASLLDNLPNRIIGNVYEKGDDGLPGLDTIFPSWIVDTVRLAQENNCAVLTDDALVLQAYAIEGENIPAGSSSISLVRCLFEQGLISFAEYLKYFRLLSSYRFFLLPVSAEEMETAVLPRSTSGLVLFTPNNIEYLNLPLTLSKEYGVNDDLAICIAADFFKRILVRTDVTESMADDIFPRVLIGVLSDRNAKLHGRILVNLCKSLLNDTPFISASSHRKFSILERQVSRYAREYNPLLKSVPSLLKTGLWA